MVIKYAMGEKDIMIAKRGKEDLDKKWRESLKDKYGLQYKIKTLTEMNAWWYYPCHAMLAMKEDITSIVFIRIFS